MLKHFGVLGDLVSKPPAVTGAVGLGRKTVPIEVASWFLDRVGSKACWE